MATAQPCSICHKRKAKRHCPGVRGEICPVCCGTEREVTVDCPYECPYLRESRRYGADRPAPPTEIPYADVEVPDSFLYEQEQLIGQIGYRLLHYALDNRLVDNHVLDALDKLIRTYQTQLSGIYYESLPEQAAAIGLYREIKKFLDETQEKQRRAGGLAPVKDSDAIRAFVFLYRLATVHANQRPLGRAFLDFLRQTYPEVAAAKEEPRLIVPGA